MKTDIKTTNWTHGEIQDLTKLHQLHTTHKEIGTILHRSSEAVSSKCKRLKLKSYKMWTKKEVKLLKRMVNQGKSAREIGNFLDKNLDCIQNKMKNLKLVSLKTLRIQKEKNTTNQFNNQGTVSLLRERLNKIKHQCKKRSKYKSSNFSLTTKFLMELYTKQKGLCHYSGIKMDTKYTPRNKRPKKQMGRPYLISIDRINSNEGYTKGNIVLCCYIINVMKSISSKSQFIKLCSKIVNWNKKLPTHK